MGESVLSDKMGRSRGLAEAGAVVAVVATRRIGSRGFVSLECEAG